jgi:hypothetical protein
MNDLINNLANDDLEVGMMASDAIIAKGRDVLSELLPYLTDSRWLLRFRIASIIEKLGVVSPDVYEAIQEAFLQEQDDSIKRKLIQALQDSRIEKLFPICDPKNFLEGRDKIDWRSIEWFSEDEIKEIHPMLIAENITFRIRVIMRSHPELPTYQERYIIEVPSDFFLPALEVLKNYFGLNEEGDGELYTGECPACGYSMENETHCPDCGLNLASSPFGNSMHPFFAFLEEIQPSESENE